MVALVVHPGRLTAEFRDGLRIRSISPWRLTFNMVALFFVLSIVTDFRIANFPKHDPSGKLADALSVAAQQANIDKVTLVDRADRFFHAIYTLLVTWSIGISAVWPVPLTCGIVNLGASTSYLRSTSRHGLSSQISRITWCCVFSGSRRI